MDGFEAHDLGLNALVDFDPIVQRVEVVAVASQLGVEDAAFSGSLTRFQREYWDSHHGYAIPEVQFPVRNSDGRQPLRCGTPSRPAAPPLSSSPRLTPLPAPSRFSGVLGLKSLAEGETSALCFELHNICAQALGRDANRRARARTNPDTNCSNA